MKMIETLAMDEDFSASPSGIDPESPNKTDDDEEEEETIDDSPSCFADAKDDSGTDSLEDALDRELANLAEEEKLAPSEDSQQESQIKENVDKSENETSDEVMENETETETENETVADKVDNKVSEELNCETNDKPVDSNEVTSDESKAEKTVEAVSDEEVKSPDHELAKISLEVMTEDDSSIDSTSTKDEDEVEVLESPMEEDSSEKRALNFEEGLNDLQKISQSFKMMEEDHSDLKEKTVNIGNYCCLRSFYLLHFYLLYLQV